MLFLAAPSPRRCRSVRCEQAGSAVQGVLLGEAWMPPHGMTSQGSGDREAHGEHPYPCASVTAGFLCRERLLERISSWLASCCGSCSSRLLESLHVSFSFRFGKAGPQVTEVGMLQAAQCYRAQHSPIGGVRRLRRLQLCGWMLDADIAQPRHQLNAVTELIVQFWHKLKGNALASTKSCFFLRQSQIASFIPDPWFLVVAVSECFRNEVWAMTYLCYAIEWKQRWKRCPQDTEFHISLLAQSFIERGFSERAASSTGCTRYLAASPAAALSERRPSTKGSAAISFCPSRKSLGLCDRQWMYGMMEKHSATNPHTTSGGSDKVRQKRAKQVR